MVSSNAEWALHEHGGEEDMKRSQYKIQLFSPNSLHKDGESNREQGFQYCASRSGRLVDISWSDAECRTGAELPSWQWDKGSMTLWFQHFLHELSWS